jgi:large subunit ribosomal protein L13
MTTRTFRLSKNDMDRSWHVLDARGVPLGRLASEAAKLLLGKHKPTYEPHLAMGDFVIIVNAREIAVTGAKAQQKVYYRHTGYPGGLRERTLQEQLDRDPRRVVEMAVRGMLPHNVRGRELFRHVKVYAGPTHPHAAQLNAGTGARAKKRAGAEQTQAARGAAATATRRRRGAAPADAVATAAPETTTEASTEASTDE